MSKRGRTGGPAAGGRRFPMGRHSTLTGAYLPQNREAEPGRLSHQVRANANRRVTSRPAPSLPVLNLPDDDDEERT